MMRTMMTVTMKSSNSFILILTPFQNKSYIHSLVYIWSITPEPVFCWSTAKCVQNCYSKGYFLMKTKSKVDILYLAQMAINHSGQILVSWRAVKSLNSPDEGNLLDSDGCTKDFWTGKKC